MTAGFGRWRVVVRGLRRAETEAFVQVMPG